MSDHGLHHNNHKEEAEAEEAREQEQSQHHPVNDIYSEGFHAFSFFPDYMKPFHDYGEAPVQELDRVELLFRRRFVAPKIQQHCLLVERLQYERRSSVLNAAHTDTDTDRYPNNNNNNNNISGKENSSVLLEDEWMLRMQLGEVVDFAQEVLDSGDDSWNILRCTNVIQSWLPLTVKNVFLEEMLEDFIIDFVLPCMLIPMAEYTSNTMSLSATDNTIDPQADGLIITSNIQNELLAVTLEMIHYFCPTDLIHSWLASFQALLRAADHECLYLKLFDTAERFEQQKPVRKDEFLPKPFPTVSEDEKSMLQFLPMNEYRIEVEKQLRKYDESVLEWELHRQALQEDYLQQCQTASLKKRQYQFLFEYLKMLLIVSPHLFLNKTHWHQSFSMLSSQQRNATFFYCWHFAPIGIAMLDDDDPLAAVGNCVSQFVSVVNQLRQSPPQQQQQEISSSPLYSIMASNGCLDNKPSGPKHICACLLTALDKFISLRYFNHVSNLPITVIYSRRTLLKYLLVDVPQSFGLTIEEVVHETLHLKLFTVFETLHMYQLLPEQTQLQCVRDMQRLINICCHSRNESNPRITSTVNHHLNEMRSSFGSNNSDEFNEMHVFVLIFISYNQTMLPHSSLLHLLRQTQLPSKEHIDAYHELLCLIMNVEQAAITDRTIWSIAEGRVQNEYNWSLSLSWKQIGSVGIGNHLAHPYYLFAGSVLLARQFGIPIVHRFKADIDENFTWLETLAFVNFTLEHQAALIRERNSNLCWNHLHSCQVIRVIDPHLHLMKMQQLPSDEPTHHVNCLIAKMRSSLPSQQRFVHDTQVDHDRLFDVVSKMVKNISVKSILSVDSGRALALYHQIISSVLK